MAECRAEKKPGSQAPRYPETKRTEQSTHTNINLYKCKEFAFFSGAISGQFFGQSHKNAFVAKIHKSLKSLKLPPA